MPDGKPCTGCATKPRVVESVRESDVIEVDERRWVVRHRINSDRFGTDGLKYRIADFAAWTRDYMKDPVVLHAHGRDYSRGTLPVGRNLSLRQAPDGSEAETQFSGDVPEDSFARLLYGLHAGKFLRAWSTGTIDDGIIGPVDIPETECVAKERATGAIVTAGRLLEYSTVGVPADPDAIDRMASVVARADSPRVVSYPTLESGLRAVVAMLRDAKGLPRSGNEIVPAVRELIAQTRETIAAVIADPPCQGCIDRQRAIVAQSGELAILHAALVGMVKQNGAN